VRLSLASISIAKEKKMVEVQGNSVRLYLEGLMFLALDEEQQRLDAGILNVDDGHNLRVRTFSRKPTITIATSDEIWEAGKTASIPDIDLRLYEKGEITILCPRKGSKNITSSMVPENKEMWMPFTLIPEFEAIVGSKVKLDRGKVKPVISITGGNFFSVLRPDHVEDAKPLNKRADTRGFIPTYRLEKNQVFSCKRNAKAHSHIQSVNDLVSEGFTAKDLAIRTYTAATIIKLDKDDELVCVLKGEQGEQFILFKVQYNPDCEAKIVIENAVTRHADGSMVHSQSEANKIAHIHPFHFLHFYEAIKDTIEKKQFLLANKDMLVEYLTDKDEIVRLAGIDPENPTGGDFPTCPAVRISNGLFND
jgi:hypothetical protein